MKHITIQAYKRTKLHGKNPRKIIKQGYLPSILYGGKGQQNKTIHIYIQAQDIQPLNYAPHFINLVLEGQKHPCILQDKQVHPVSNIPIHADFLRMTQDKSITMLIPVKIEGKAIGTTRGGLLLKKIRRLKVKTLPQNMPEKVVVDVSKLDLGQSIQVEQVTREKFAILDNPTSLVVTVEIPRALRSKQNKDEAASTS